MSRPTVASCLALIEKQNLLIAELEERLKKVENSQFQRKHDAPVAKPRNSWRPNGGTNYALFAPDACKHFGVKTVTKEQIYAYISEVECKD